MDRYKVIFLLIMITSCISNIQGQQLSVKTNAMYWLTSTPNFSVEVGFNKHMSAQLAIGYNAWAFSGTRSFKHYVFTPEVRYWLTRPMERHYIGFYAQAGKFNLRKVPLFAEQQLVYRGTFYGTGLSYGYQWALGDRWGIEASLGIGYARIPYGLFAYTECCAERISTHTRNYFGPTKLGLNIIYIIR